MPFSLGSDAISLLVRLLGLDEVISAFCEEPFLHEDTAVEQFLVDLDNFSQLTVDLSDLLDLRIKRMDLLRVEVQDRLDLMNLPNTLRYVIVDAVDARLISPLHIPEA